MIYCFKIDNDISERPFAVGSPIIRRSHLKAEAPGRRLRRSPSAYLRYQAGNSLY